MCERKLKKNVDINFQIAEKICFGSKDKKFCIRKDKQKVRLLGAGKYVCQMHHYKVID